MTYPSNVLTAEMSSIHHAGNTLVSIGPLCLFKCGRCGLPGDILWEAGDRD